MNNASIYLNNVARLCQKELDVLNIPYAKGIVFTVNTRAKTRWGQCRYNVRTRTYSINIAEVLCTPTNVEGLKDTIIHELLHSVPNGLSHSGEWKRYATMVNNYYGYNISRTASASEKGCEMPKRVPHYKYVAVCDKCGQVIKRQKKSDFVKNMEHYSCGRCGGHFTLIQGE